MPEMAETVEQITTQEHTLHIPDAEEGDLRVTWDPNESVQVEEARAAFDRATNRGMVAYRMAPGGARGEQIREFDPAAESILMATQMVGG
jgi:hypothetical protein